MRRHGVVAIGLAMLVGGCHVILGFEEGIPFCEGKPEGTPLPDFEQRQGDCLTWVCNGSGERKLVEAPYDVDDGDPCTLDECVETAPKYTSLRLVPCYSGDPTTRKVGACRSGIQKCDENGKPLGGCAGAVLPAERDVCGNGRDDDCDGSVDEDFEDCSCGDGTVMPAIGEECDDGEAQLSVCSGQCTREPVVGISASGHRTCTWFANGRVKCWGHNFAGQLGVGDTENRGDASGEMGAHLPPVDLGTGVDVEKLVAGEIHACGVLIDGKMKCWGAASLGLDVPGSHGASPDGMGDALPFVSLGTGRTVTAVALGNNHTCALLDKGNVKCWGRNYEGELGQGDTVDRGDNPNEMGDALSVVSLGSGSYAIAVAAGAAHSCALLDDGRVKCWGDNSFGQLGLGDTNPRGNIPNQMGDNLPSVDLGAGKTAIALRAGGGNTCALLNDGTIKCWGGNWYGELGLGDANHRGDQPNEMGNFLPAVDLGTDSTIVDFQVGLEHICALLSGGRIKCWGSNQWGAVGLGAPDPDAPLGNFGDEPGEMGDLLPFVDLGPVEATAITAGGFHTCALLQDGTVKCWGANDTGQLGLGDTKNRGDSPDEMGEALPTVKLYSDYW